MTHTVDPPPPPRDAVALRGFEASAVADLVRLVGYWISEDFQGALVARAGVLLESRDVPGLLVLGRVDSLRPGQLARALRASPALASKLTDRLVRGGFAERRPDPTDGRATVVSRTPAGAEAALRLHNEGRAVFSELLSGWSPADAKSFATLLHRFSEQIDSG